MSTKINSLLALNSKYITKNRIKYSKYQLKQSKIGVIRVQIAI